MRTYVEQISIVNDEGVIIHKFERPIDPDRVIMYLTGAGTEVITETVTSGRITGQSGKKIRICSKCETPGHTAPSCTRSPSDRELVEAVVPPEEEEPEQDPAEDSAEPAFERPAFGAEKDGAMGAIEYLKVKDMNRNGKKSFEISTTIRRNIREVNKAIMASSHGEYLKLRKQ